MQTRLMQTRMPERPHPYRMRLGDKIVTGCFVAAVVVKIVLSLAG